MEEEGRINMGEHRHAIQQRRHMELAMGGRKEEVGGEEEALEEANAPLRRRRLLPLICLACLEALCQRKEEGELPVPLERRGSAC